MAEIKDKVTFKGNPITLVGNEVKAGDTAPDFTVLSPELKEVKLSDYKGKYFHQLTQEYVRYS